MGIRESLEELPKEENLKNFVMPEDEPEQELEFDVEKEFAPEEIKKIADWIISKRLNLLEDNQDTFAVKQNAFDLEVSVEAASNFKSLFPDKIDKLDSNLEDGYWSIFIDISGQDYNLKDLTEYLHSLKNIFPDRFSASEFGSNEFKDRLKRRCFERLKSYKVVFFSGSGILDFKKNTLLLFPEEHLPEDDLEYKPRSENIADVLSFYADLRLVYPEKYAEMSKTLDLGKILSKYQRLKSELEKEKRYFPLLSMTLNMQIIFAQEARITENGLEIIMPEKESFQPEKHKRPERRDF